MYFKKEEYNKSGVYKITCMNQVYIGSSICVYNRLMEHRSHLRHNSHHNEHLQNYYNKYGEDSFNVELLEECCKKDIKCLRDRELYYIETNECGFNKTTPVTYVASEESKQKISNTLKRMYKEGVLSPPMKYKGILVDVYDEYGNLVFKSTTIGQISRHLNYSNRSVIRLSLIRGNRLFKNHIIFYQDRKDYNEWVLRTEGRNIPVYKISKDGIVTKCSDSSKEKVNSKLLSSDNFMYFSKHKSCYYTYISKIIECPYYKKL